MSYSVNGLEGWRCLGIMFSLLLYLSSREPQDYQGREVRQENQGAPAEMCVIYNIIIINACCSVAVVTGTMCPQSD